MGGKMAAEDYMHVNTGLIQYVESTDPARLI